MSGGRAAPRRTSLGRVWGFMTFRLSRIWQVLVAMAGLALLWWGLPLALYKDVASEDVRVKAITDTRTALLAGLIGLGAIGTFWLNSRIYKITARTFELTEQGTSPSATPRRSNSSARKDSMSASGASTPWSALPSTPPETTRRSSRSLAPLSGNTATQLVEGAVGLLLLVTTPNRQPTYRPPSRS